MDELAEDPRPVALNRLDAPAHHLDAVLVPRFEHDSDRELRRLVDDRAAGDDEPDTAACPLLLKRDLPVGHAPELDQARAHRGLDDPVGDRDAGDGAGRKQVRIHRSGVAHVVGSNIYYGVN